MVRRPRDSKDPKQLAALARAVRKLEQKPRPKGTKDLPGEAIVNGWRSK